MKTEIIGTLAHVDAGKTTLSESMLYLSGSIRTMGRVDHGNAFLDYDNQERSRGITIFSKQATMTWKDTEMTFIDTPGHIDFSAEMERTLQILDYAILVISGLDGVQAHTETIWNLLKHYHIPTFIFVNKMDIAHYSKNELLNNLQERLHEHCIDFTEQGDEFYENVALTSDELMEDFLELGILEDQQIAHAVANREVFPVYFGSALKMNGVDAFLDGLHLYMKEQEYPDEFGAKVYKISRDEQGNRLTHLKVTGGSLKAKTKIRDDEKADQLRCYSGNKYQLLPEVHAGKVCAVKGFRNIHAGEGLGFEGKSQPPMLASYMNYHIVLPEGCDHFAMLKNLYQLAEEDPQLHVSYEERSQSIRIQVMGDIQIEVLKNLIRERFHVDVEFDQGTVNYKETILEPVEGVGHYEPLRHYAEVHILLEPGEAGSGLQIKNNCSQDALDSHWQRLILAHLEEKEHLGVLSGSPITDMKITLLGGKAHLKHTEGGDFRQATYRAVRQGLKSTKSVLLEPYYTFRLEIPNEYLSKAIYDIELRKGTYTLPPTSGEMTVLVGSAPVARMQNYQSEVAAYTKGAGKLSCILKGYEPCEMQDKVIEEIGYDSERDLDNPTGSVFCSHGAGFYVKWNEVKNHMHIGNLWEPKREAQDRKVVHSRYRIDDAEVERVYTSIYGPIKRKRVHDSDYKKTETENSVKISEKVPECLLVDGYNIIHSWPELKEMAKDNLDAARMRLIDLMANYQGYKGCLLILVFDAYKVKENMGAMYRNQDIFIVYTKTSQTADSYIENATHKLSKDYRVTVATSDAMEQLIVAGQGAARISSREFLREVDYVHKNETAELRNTQPQYRNHALEEIRVWNERTDEDTTDD